MKSSRSCANLLQLSLAILAVLAAPILLVQCARNSTCPPNDDQCNQTRRTGWSLSSRLPPLPSVGTSIGVDVEDSALINLTGDSVEDSRAQTNLAAGHRCSSSSQCDSNLSCEPFPNSPVPKLSTVLPIPSSSTLFHNKRSTGLSEDQPLLLVADGQIGLCSRKDCRSTCENGTAPIRCPSDSYVDERDSNDGEKCCIQTCKCLPHGCLRPTNCTAAYDLISEGNLNKPGNCCSQFKCIDDPNLEGSKAHASAPTPPKQYCEYPKHSGKNYSLGASWFSSKCEKCQCRDGVSLCNEISINCPTQWGCATSSTVLADDQCCEKCKECLYNKTEYLHLDSWKEDFDCKTCSCTHGHIKCHSEMCRPVECGPNEQLIKVEGVCCLQCQCKLECDNGFAHYPNGIKKCECAGDDDFEPTLGTVVSEVSTEQRQVVGGGQIRVGTCTGENCLDAGPTSAPASANEGSTAAWLIPLGIVVIFVACFGLIGHIICRGKRAGGSASPASTVNYQAVNQIDNQHHQYQQQAPSVASTLPEKKPTDEEALRKKTSGGGPAQGQQRGTANGHATPHRDEPTGHSPTLNFTEETSQV